MVQIVWNTGDLVKVDDNGELREARILDFTEDDDDAFVVEVVFDNGRTGFYYESDVVWISR